MRLLAVAVLVLVLSAADNRTFDVRGIVMPVGEERGGMRVATIRLESLESPFAQTTRSEANYGRFSISQLPEGFYLLTARSTLGHEVRKLLNLRASETNLWISIGRSDEPSAIKRRLTVRVPQLAVSLESKKLYRAADAECGKGRFDDANRILQQSVAASPTFGAAWAKLATISFHAGRLAEAEKYAREGLTHDRDDDDCLFILGRILITAHRPREALQFNRAAMEHLPFDALTCAQYGFNLLLVGQRDEAARYLKRARIDEPENTRNPLFWRSVYKVVPK